MPIIQGLIFEHSKSYTDGWRRTMVSCSTATNITVSRWKLRYECHSENEFARGKSHVNGIENF